MPQCKQCKHCEQLKQCTQRKQPVLAVLVEAVEAVLAVNADYKAVLPPSVMVFLWMDCSKLVDRGRKKF